MLQLYTLGELRLMDGRGELLSARRKELVLLVYLARRGPRPASREELAALFWGDTPDSRARHSLRQALFDLKHALGPALEVGRQAIGVQPDHVELDVVALDADLAAGRFEEAAARWEGEFLAGLDDLGGEVYRAWLDSERDVVRRQMSWALDRLADDAQRRGDWGAIARWKERQAAIWPLDEAPHLQLIKALHRDNRTAEALAHHARFTARLRGEAELEPSPKFTSLAREIERSGRLEAALVPTPGSAALFTPDLVGREAELGELQSAWSAARQGFPTVVILEGEEGLGKSRLADAFLQRAEQSGDVLVLRGRGDLTTDAVGSDWRAARVLFAPLSDAPGLGGIARSQLAELSRLVPALRARFPNLPAARDDETVLLPALIQALDVVAAEVPIILFIDDFDRADADSARLVSSVARQLPGAAILLLVATSTHAPLASPLRTLSGSRRLRLHPLSVGEVDALIASMLACTNAQRRELAMRLHSEGGGSPMFVAEMVAALVDGGSLTPDTQGYWRLALASGDAPLPLPATVREAISHRIRALDDDARSTLVAAARLPQPVGASKLERETGLTATRVRVAVDRLVAMRLLTEAPGGPGRYTFAHALVGRVAQQLAGEQGERAAVPVLPRPITHGAGIDLPQRRRAWRELTARPLLWAAAAAIVLAGASIRLFSPGAPDERASVLAVGLISDYAGTDTTRAARALPEMLATNLARLPEFQVVSQTRMYEILEQWGRPQPTAAALAGAARRAGARELIEGELYHSPGRPLRLELRHINLETGQVRAVYTVEAAEVLALIDKATQRLARELSAATEPLRIADATTSSLVAYRMYEQGLRAHYQGDLPTARGFLRAALEEDPEFGLAAYYLWQTERQLGLLADSTIERGILRLAEIAPDRERLIMRALWAHISADPGLGAMAETLVARHPSEPDGHLLLGRARLLGGEFLGAIPHLQQVVRIDSLSLSGHAARCRACDALSSLISAYSLADSLPAAERVARDWVRMQPNSGRAWAELAGTLESQDKLEQALAVHQHGATLRAGSPSDPIFSAVLAIRGGNFEAADRLLREQAKAGTPAVRRQALWFWTISLRYQGRLREALQTARTLRRLSTDSLSLVPAQAVAEAQVLFEMRRFREAAALFDSLAALPPPDVARRPLASAGWRSWRLTHAAAALAAASDTAALARLADTIQSLTIGSGYARDRRLHHHVRGLLLQARGQPEQAVTELYRANYSLPYGYSRTNFEIAESLLALGRADEAIRVLQPAFRGWIEVGGLYVTRPNLHVQLGRAFEAAGQRDSAAAHYHRALHAWRAADAELHPRRDSIRVRLAAIRGSPAAQGLRQQVTLRR